MIYTAVTIGPIFKTIGKARSVKAFWTASYMFSWIMKRLIEELGGCSILSPHLPEEEPSFDTIKTKVGLFPDRLFIEGDAKAHVKRAKEKIIKELTEKGIGDIPEYLDSYISISTILVDVPDAEEGPLKILNEYLDTQELFCKSSPQGKDYMEEFMENAKNGFLQGFKGESERPFESTSEIAVSGWLSLI
ncbi:type III-B CRISPR-associated protein Cas10/Cmr2 [Porphyromonas cangingivalis]|uniref:type III-B CRISPR-associated protein Cas10/Cmr2 n=1 Tax=Porphyromonas cangingivalis TaxID=36874 RepID=UPI000A5BA659|nr:type III-B CRISPR-associated protein Cas10/Cmr2 [Porphyromonas cangingivalis]